MQVLFLDGYNLIYRARYSFAKGDNSVVYSFFRSLRALVEKFQADKMYFVTEGYPEHRYILHPGYKGTRQKDDDQSFHRQKKEIIQMLKEYFPLTVCRHPHQECDDVIANLVLHKHQHDDCVVVSTDTDFLQLYNTCQNVKIYNPIKKKFAEPPGFDYVTWKSLRGDPSDNIPGIKGIGDKRASMLVSDPDMLVAFLTKDPSYSQILERNRRLIRFVDLRDDIPDLEYAPPKAEWDIVKNKFENMGFHSITNEKGWLKFHNTFKKLQENVA